MLKLTNFATRSMVSAAAVALLAVCLLPAISSAVIVQTTTYDHTSQTSFFPISTDDLINTGQSTFLSQDITGSANSTGVPSNLNNGSTGTATTHATAYWDHSNVWSTTFNLDTSSNTLGYDITEINTVAGWTNANVFQEYELFVSVVGDASFTSLGTVNMTFIALDGLNHSTQAKWTDTTGTIATGVDAVRFVFADDIAPIAAIYREIDVIGAATVPEPSSMALVALSLVGMISLRKRNRC